jgi:hypothetical protein
MRIPLYSFRLKNEEEINAMTHQKQEVVKEGGQQRAESRQEMRRKIQKEAEEKMKMYTSAEVDEVANDEL